MLSSINTADTRLVLFLHIHTYCTSKLILFILAHLVFTVWLVSLGESLGVNGRSRLVVEPRPPSADVWNTSDGCLPIDEADGGRELLMASTLASVFVAAVVFGFLLLRLDLFTQQ